MECLGYVYYCLSKHGFHVLNMLIQGIRCFIICSTTLPWNIMLPYYLTSFSSQTCGHQRACETCRSSQIAGSDISFQVSLKPLSHVLFANWCTLLAWALARPDRLNGLAARKLYSQMQWVRRFQCWRSKHQHMANWGVEEQRTLKSVKPLANWKRWWFRPHLQTQIDSILIYIYTHIYIYIDFISLGSFDRNWNHLHLMFWTLWPVQFAQQSKAHILTPCEIVPAPTARICCKSAGHVPRSTCFGLQQGAVGDATRGEPPETHLGLVCAHCYKLPLWELTWPKHMFQTFNLLFLCTLFYSVLCNLLLCVLLKNNHSATILTP